MNVAFRSTSGRYPDIFHHSGRREISCLVSYVWPPGALNKAGASRLALGPISSRITHLSDPRMTEAKHGMARIPTIVAYDLLSFEGFLALPRAIPKNLFITRRYVFTPTIGGLRWPQLRWQACGPLLNALALFVPLASLWYTRTCARTHTNTHTHSKQHITPTVLQEQHEIVDNSRVLRSLCECGHILCYTYACVCVRAFCIYMYVCVYEYIIYI